MDKYGDPWKSTWEPVESVNAPDLVAKFLAKRESSAIPYYDEENRMWENLPIDTVDEDILEELAGYTIGALSSSDEDEV